MPLPSDPLRHAEAMAWGLVNSIFPLDLRGHATQDHKGRLVWPLSSADAAAETLELAGLPIILGEAWLSSGGRVPQESLMRALVKTPRIHWVARWEEGEDVELYTARTHTECRARLEEAKQLVAAHGPNAEISVRLQWMDPSVVGRFDLPPVLSELLKRLTRDGHEPWNFIAAAHSVYAGGSPGAGGVMPGSLGGAWRTDRLDEVPANARYLRIGRDLADLSGLGRLNRLRVLCLSLPARKGRREKGVAFLETVRNLHSLEALDLSNLEAPDLEPLASLKKLTHLSLHCPRMPGLSGIERLERLETLTIHDGRHVQTLDRLAHLPRLRGLYIAGDMHTVTKLASLAPLSEVRSLRAIRFVSVRVADGLLRPLVPLKELRFISLPNYFKRAEFAELTAAFPDALGERSNTIWFMEPRRAAKGMGSCRRCGEFQFGLTLGKPMLRLCPRCDAEKIEKLTQRYDAMVAAAVARQSGERSERGATRHGRPRA